MFELKCNRPWLVARFVAPQRMVGWSLNRPGFVDASEVAWLEVADGELRDIADVTSWFRKRLDDDGHGGAAGMITARNVGRYERAVAQVDDTSVECVITLGLNNGEHVGRRVQAPGSRVGTINILCSVCAPLTDGALLEASSIATQARTAALIECGYRRPGQSAIVTGTGTDCIIVSAPHGPKPAEYAGMHTAIGEAVGAAVRDATARAAAVWRAEWEDRLAAAASISA